MSKYLTCLLNELTTETLCSSPVNSDCTPFRRLRICVYNWLHFGMIGNATDGQNLRDDCQTLNLPADTLLYYKSQLY
jgi:hypothetical protein